MEFDFDRVIDRRNSHCDKWDEMEMRFGLSPGDSTPMWVADMDFTPPPAVNRVVRAAAEHGVHGYFGDDREFREAVAGWMRRRHGWSPDPAAILTCHGLGQAVSICLNALTEPGDGVMLFTPVYHSFALKIRANGRRVVEVPLKIEEGRHVPDMEAAEKAAENASMVIWCSPHNPGGRVWSAEENRAIADLAERHGLILVSDEIHADLVFPGSRHVMMPLAAPGARGRTVMLTAGSKTFNMAGCMTGNMIAEDAALRARLQAGSQAAGFFPNRLGVMMMTAAYAEGDAWLEALIAYLDGNRRLLDEATEQVPGVRSMRLEATYLAWLDLTRTGLSDAEIGQRLKERARIAGMAGPVFGTGGSGWLRLNFALPRTLLSRAMQDFRAAFADLQ